MHGTSQEVHNKLLKVEVSLVCDRGSPTIYYNTYLDRKRKHTPRIVVKENLCFLLGMEHLGENDEKLGGLRN
jgi:hypothetical protein